LRAKRRISGPPRPLARPVLKRKDVNHVHEIATVALKPVSGFWSQLLSDPSLRERSDLEKLLTGCEIIAALDDLEMLEGA